MVVDVEENDVLEVELDELVELVELDELVIVPVAVAEMDKLVVVVVEIHLTQCMKCSS